MIRLRAGELPNVPGMSRGVIEDMIVEELLSLRAVISAAARVPFGGPAMSTDTKRDQGRLSDTQPLGQGLEAGTGRRDGRFSSFLLHPSSLGLPRRAAGSCGTSSCGSVGLPTCRLPPPAPNEGLAQRGRDAEGESKQRAADPRSAARRRRHGWCLHVGATGHATAVGRRSGDRKRETRKDSRSDAAARGTRTERRAQKTVPPDACRTSLALGCGTAAGYESGCLQRREIKKIFPLRRGVSARVSEKRSWVLGFRS